MLGTFLMKVGSKGRRRVSTFRKRRRVEAIALRNLSIAAFHSSAPPRDERGKRLVCKCFRSSHHGHVQVERSSCPICRHLRVFP